MPVQPLVELMNELASSSRDKADEKTLRALQTVVEFYRDAFERFLEILEQQGQQSLVDRLIEDPLLESILRGYGLVRDDVEAEVKAALDSVSPFIQSHGGRVTLVGVTDKIAYLEFGGSCHGCSASLITLKSVIEKTLKEQVPELKGIEVGGLTQGAPHDTRKWLPLLHGSELKLAGREFFKVQLFDDEILVCAVDQHAFAFKNRCPAGSDGLESALRDGLFITCRCHGYRFDLRSGQHPENPDLRLAVLPLKLSDDLIKVGL